MKLKFLCLCLFIYSLYQSGYCQANKFVIDELKLSLYYLSDTSTEKDVTFLDDDLIKLNHEKITDGTIFYKDYANVRIGNKYGFIDKRGNVKLFPDYAAVMWTDGPLGVALKNDKIGYVDREGNVKVSMQYNMGTFFYNHLAVVRKDSTYSLLSENGQSLLSSDKLIFPPGITPLITFLSDTGIGMMSENKSVVIEPIYRYLIGAENGLIKAVNRNKTYGSLDATGNVIIPFEYENIKIARSGELIPAKKNGKWGYINIKNEMVINFIYDEAYFFSEGLAAVVVQKKTGFIDKNGKFVIEPQYDFSFNFGSNYSFNGGISPVFINKKWGFIDKKGTVLITPSYDYVTGFNKEKAIVGINKKYGIIDKRGNTLIPLVNDKIQRSENGIFKVVNGKDKWPEDNGMENLEAINLYKTLMYLYKN